MEVYTDGACAGNGTPHARGGIGVWFAKDSPLNVSRAVRGPVHTNNVAELQAIEAALDSLAARGVTHATVYSDSMYAINAVTLWAPKWAAKGWRTAAGTPVANQELIAGIVARLGGSGFRDVTLAYVRGHAGVEGNEGADALARAACAAKAAASPASPAASLASPASAASPAASLASPAFAASPASFASPASPASV
jgi:ribonuclease HI